MLDNEGVTSLEFSSQRVDKLHYEVLLDQDDVVALSE